MSCTLLAATGLTATPALAAPGPPANITMTGLTPAVVVANGTSRATATVSLSDTATNPIAGDASGLALSASDPRVSFGPVIDNGDGTYTISVMSSTTAHQVTVTVTETSTAISASQRLIQTHGPAQNVAVVLTPNVIRADALATTTATITVTDAGGNPVAGDALAIASSVPGVHLGPVTDRAAASTPPRSRPQGSRDRPRSAPATSPPARSPPAWPRSRRSPPRRCSG